MTTMPKPLTKPPCFLPPALQNARPPGQMDCIETLKLLHLRKPGAEPNHHPGYDCTDGNEGI